MFNDTKLIRGNKRKLRRYFAQRESSGAGGCRGAGERAQIAGAAQSDSDRGPTCVSATYRPPTANADPWSRDLILDCPLTLPGAPLTIHTSVLWQWSLYSTKKKQLIECSSSLGSTQAAPLHDQLQGYTEGKQLPLSFIIWWVSAMLLGNN